MEKKFDLRLIKLEKLKEHEEIERDYFKELLKEIIKDGILKRPIVADKKTKVILDGEHRVQVLKKIGCRKIPTILLNYNSPKIKVKSWGKDKNLFKEKIIEMALAGKKFPPKITRHLILLKNKFRHISAIQRRIDISLEELR